MGRERLETDECQGFGGPIVCSNHHHVYIVYRYTKQAGPIVCSHHHHVYIVYRYTKHAGPIVCSRRRLNSVGGVEGVSGAEEEDPGWAATSPEYAGTFTVIENLDLVRNYGKGGKGDKK